MKYTIIESLEPDFPVATLWRVLEAPRSGYDRRRRHTPTARRMHDATLLTAIRHRFMASHETNGSQRIPADLRDLADEGFASYPLWLEL